MIFAIVNRNVVTPQNHVLKRPNSNQRLRSSGPDTVRVAIALGPSRSDFEASGLTVTQP